ncbi:MAG TPA: hypothetical protein VF763_08950 [Candidatus Limnocylindrales bacterium]
MTEPPRLLVIMGSGETTPTMARVHREVLDRLGPRPVPAVLLDTPYGFQENAEDITARALDYFRESVGHPLEVAAFRTADGELLERETALARVREARYVFSGPGSPSYALRQWTGSEIPRLLADKLARGGAIVVASAAALTVGLLTVPVYEIYKVGEPPRWLPGLDLLSPLGLRAAVLPHYDNAEGGTHDTRFCYLGERRLEVLERRLPDDAWILGIDGHTALTLDLDAGTAQVSGLGGVTVRRAGRSRVLAAGERVGLAELAAIADQLAAGGSGGAAARPEPGRREVAAPTPPRTGGKGRSPLHETVARLEADFEAALAARDAPAAVRVVLATAEAVQAWSRDTEESGELEAARASMRSMIVRLGELAVAGTRDPRDAVAPFVDALVEQRLAARTARDWAAADAIRDRLLAAGVELHDTADGTTWDLERRAATR